MPRVLLLNQYYAPDEAATAQLLADLGEGLAAAGFQVTAICGDRSYGDPTKRYPTREVINGVEVRRTRTSGFGRGTKLGRIADYLTFFAGAKLHLFFGPKPDVVISLSTPPMVALLGTFIGRLRGAKTVFWSMDVYPDVAYQLGAIRKGSLVGFVISNLAHLTHRLPDLVVALGDTMKDKLEAGGAKTVTVIHNWSDGDAIRPMPLEENPLRKEWNWHDRFVLMYSGNMGLGHEFETALGGISRFRDFAISRFEDSGDHASSNRAITQSRNREILLAFLGTGPRLSEVKSRAAALGLTSEDATSSSNREITQSPNREIVTSPSNREIAKSRNREMVLFHPYVPRHDLPLSLTAPDVHLVTMREGMPGLIVPSKIYGILAAGKPTIYVGPAEGEIHEILMSGSCGIHVPIGDTDAFVEAVARYRDNPDLVAEHGRNARRLFQERFTRTRGIAEWQRVIADLGSRS